ncbi:MAG TPA: YccF domain-containing protein [Thermoanaerobaculia bacterium]|nr:YccF domain-containing protein [Thermoanaerobaculia bacterium]
MATVGNILWFVLGGFLIAFGYLLGGVLLCLTIVGIPFGVQAFKLARAVAAPFGTKIVEREGASGCVPVALNVIWILLPGLELAVIHLVLAILLGVTIVGLPFARQHLKLVPLALMPFGRDIVAAPER